MKIVRDERGQVAGIEAIPFGLVVVLVATLLLANTWAVIDARLATDAAAREAVRTFVESWPDEAGGWRAAEQRGREAVAAQGRDGGSVRFELALIPGYQRCARATVTARYSLPALAIPYVGGFGHGFAIAATRSEVIDPYRSGGPAGGGCG